MDGDRMLALAQALAVAKSRQDVPAAMRFFHSGMVLETLAFGSTARGPVANRKALTRFFRWFPDYAVDLCGHAVGEGSVRSRRRTFDLVVRPVSAGEFWAGPDRPPGVVRGSIRIGTTSGPPRCSRRARSSTRG